MTPPAIWASSGNRRVGPACLAGVEPHTSIDPFRDFLYLPTFPSSLAPRSTVDHHLMRPTPSLALWLLTIPGMSAAAGCRLAGTTVVEHQGIADAPTATDATRSKPAARTIHLEVLFVRCDEHDQLLREELWTFVDEQVLGDSLRRGLNANGIRAGVVTGHLPPHLAERFTSVAEPAGDVAGVDPALARRLLQLLPGRRSELVTAAHLESLVLLEQCAGEVRGATYYDATPQLALETRTVADGRVRLEAVPEIKHGPVEKSWVGEDGMFRLETGQRKHRIDHLGIDVTLPPGGLLVLGCAGDDAATVGDGLLRDHGRGDRATVRLLAIRPLAHGVDPVFAPPDPAARQNDDSTSLTSR